MRQRKAEVGRLSYNYLSPKLCFFSPLMLLDLLQPGCLFCTVMGRAKKQSKYIIKLCNTCMCTVETVSEQSNNLLNIVYDIAVAVILLKLRYHC